MASITEGMRYRKKIVEYAILHNNNALAARKFRKTRQYVSYWRKRYVKGDIESLRKKSTRPNSHPNQHTEKELELIRHMYRYHRHKGLAHVFRKCQDEGYTRCYDSMCRQIRKMKLNTKPKIKHYYKKKKKVKLIATFPGEIVQIDIKYIPNSCIGFISNHERYYQITAIDLYSRKRVMAIVNEKSTYSTMEFIKTLEEKMGFPIKTVQTDNGTEFCNDNGKLSGFQKELMKLGICHKRTAPYSPWQNGCVERSHREDERRFYRNRRFKSEEEMYTAFNRHANSYNNIYRKILNFKSPNEVVEEYFRKAA